MSFFLSKCRSDTEWTQFGIIDDNNAPNDPAYISDTNPTSWTGIVKNEKATPLAFYAIDKCMLFYKSSEPSNLESTCDAAIVYGNTIYFIELKERCGPGWLAKACSQILNTITLYRDKEPNSEQLQLIGQVCNSLRPRASSSHMNEIRKFYSQSGCKLIVQQNIIMS